MSRDEYRWAGGVRVRVAAGWKRPVDHVLVDDFGAIGDGVADDTAALQAAFDAGAASKQTIYLGTGKTYKTSSSVRLGTGAESHTVILDGRGATIRCQSVVRGVLEVIDNVVTVKSLKLEGWRSAQYSLYYEGASTSYFENVVAYQPTIDGFHSHYANDRVMIVNCTAKLCGIVHHTAGYAGGAPANIRHAVTGTISKTAGSSCVLTRDSGDVDFTTLNIRRGDMIALHATAPGTASSEWLQIDSVDSATQLTCAPHPVSVGSANGLQFSIHVGDAYHEGPGRADNNINRVDNFLGENCAGSAVHLGGLYGARVTNLQANGCFGYPVVIGTSYYQTIGAYFHGVYFELCQPRGNFFFGGAAGVTVDTANVEEGSVPHVSSGGFNWGTLTNFQNANDPGRIDPVEETSASYVPSVVISERAHVWGKIKSRSYMAYQTAGGGYLEMSDFNVGAGDAPWKAVAGQSWGYAGTANASFQFDTDATVTQNAADVLSKHFAKWNNNGTFVAGIGVGGDYRVPTTDSSGTPGNTTISKPSGRFAMAALATTVTVTCALCKPSSKVLLSKQSLDATATDFKVVPGDGSFVITSNQAATAVVVFDFVLVNGA